MVCKSVGYGYYYGYGNVCYVCTVGMVYMACMFGIVCMGGVVINVSYVMVCMCGMHDRYDRYGMYDQSSYGMYGMYGIIGMYDRYGYMLTTCSVVRVHR